MSNNTEILILGGGISGCSIAYMLKRKNYKVKIIEQERIGGLCATSQLGGVNYEFGPHICYANENTAAFDLFHELLPEFQSIKYFPKQSIFGEINDLATFPITVSNVLKLPPNDTIKAIEELYYVNLNKPSYNNFEDYIISRVGKTMYEYCYKNYNKKQWGLEPKDMDSEWAKFRNFYLRSGDYGMFGEKWQGHPGSYNNFFDRLIDGIPVINDKVKKIIYDSNCAIGVETLNGHYTADVIISTLPVDEIIGEKDELEYRGITKLFYLLKGNSGLPTYLCTFPNNYSWTRITDYGLQAKQNNENTLISFAIPHSSRCKELEIDSWNKEASEFINIKLKREIIQKHEINYNYVYPISSKKMLEKYNSIIKKVAEIKNLISFGRLGLYSYISMCTAIDQADNVANNLEQVLTMNRSQKYDYYTKLRERLS